MAQKRAARSEARINSLDIMDLTVQELGRDKAVYLLYSALSEQQGGLAPSPKLLRRKKNLEI